MKLSKALISLSGLIALILLAACSSGAASPDSAAGDINLSEAARITPEDTQDLLLIDFKKLKEDADFADFYDSLVDDLEFLEDSMNIDPLDITFMVLSNISSSEGVRLLQGDFLKEDIIDALEDADYEDDVYREVEIWEGSRSFVISSVVAFPNTNRVAMGEDRNAIRAIIRASVGEETTYQEHEDVNDILGRLPSGVIYGMTIACDEDDFDAIAAARGCLAQGISVAKMNSSTVEITLVSKFENESRAERELENLEEEFEREQGEDDIFNVSTDQSGDIVTIKGQMDIQDFIDGF